MDIENNKKELPRKTIKDKSYIINNVIDEYVENGRVGITEIVVSYGVSMKKFYTWLDDTGLRSKYESVKWAAEAKGKKFKTLELDVDMHKGKLLMYAELLHLIERGKTIRDACKSVGVQTNTFYRDLGIYPKLKELYTKAKELRYEFVRTQRAEHMLEALKKADTALLDKLQTRFKRTVVETKGTTQLGGGLVVPIDKKVSKVEELEPDSKAIELVYKLAGLLQKSPSLTVDVNVEVLKEATPEETFVIQQDDLKEIERLSRMKEEENKDNE